MRARAFILLALAMLALACRTEGLALDAGPPSDTADRPRVEIGTRESGAIFTPWHDGDVIAEQWGSQGGVMVTPAVAIDGRLVSAASPSFDVVITNYRLPDRAALGEFPAFGPIHALFARLDTRLVDGPLFDQIGWSDQTGLALLLRARVSGMGVDAVGEVEIVVGAPLTARPDAGAFDGTRDGG